MKYIHAFFFSAAAFFIACGGNATNSANAPAVNSENSRNSSTSNSIPAKTVPPPSKAFTKDDIAKLKWIEGSWKGMDGENPFYERYKIEENAMVVEELREDGSVNGEPGRYELKDGEFGKGEGDLRSAASEIGDGFIQFVPGTESKGNTYRFERKGPDTWHAILEWQPTADKPARQKVYIMERIKK